jgi:hypothetical protein
VADEFEEAGHDFSQRGVEGGQGLGDGGDVGLELGWSGSLIIRRKARCESRPFESQAA